MDEEKRRVHILKQKIGLSYFPSSFVREAGVIHEGNREAWASLKRAEETYISLQPMLRGPEGVIKVGKSVLVEEQIRQSLASMRQLTTDLLGDSDRAWELVGELTRRVASFRDAKPPK